MKYAKTTYTGRIVYDRRKHPFVPKDFVRIVEKYNNSVDRDDLVLQPNAGYIRALFFQSRNLYNAVRHLFAPSIQLSEYRQVKEGAKRFTSEIIRDIAMVASDKIGLVAGYEAEWASQNIIEWLGFAIDDFFENLFTGDITERI